MSDTGRWMRFRQAQVATEIEARIKRIVDYMAPKVQAAMARRHYYEAELGRAEARVETQIDEPKTVSPREGMGLRRRG